MAPFLKRSLLSSSVSCSSSVRAVKLDAVAAIQVMEDMLCFASMAIRSDWCVPLHCSSRSRARACSTEPEVVSTRAGMGRLSDTKVPLMALTDHGWHSSCFVNMGKDQTGLKS